MRQMGTERKGGDLHCRSVTSRALRVVIGLCSPLQSMLSQTRHVVLRCVPLASCAVVCCARRSMACQSRRLWTVELK